MSTETKESKEYTDVYLQQEVIVNNGLSWYHDVCSGLNNTVKISMDDCILRSSSLL